MRAKFIGSYLRYRNESSVFAESGLFEELWDLGCLSGSSLSNDNGNRRCFDDIKKTILMASDRQECSRLIKRRYKVGVCEIRHFEIELASTLTSTKKTKAKNRN